MIQEIINFVDTLPDEVFTNNLQPKEGLYILLDIDEHGNLVNVDEEGKINEEDIGKYVQKEPVFSEHLNKCNSFFQNSRVMGKGTNKSFNSSSGLFSAVATPFGIGFTKNNYTNPDRDRTKKFIDGQIDAYFKAAASYVIDNERYKENMRRLHLFCSTFLFDYINRYEVLSDLKKAECVCFFIKNLKNQDYITVSQKYFAQRYFNIEKTLNTERIGIYARTHNINTDKPFLSHITGINKNNFWINEDTAAKLESFYSIQKYLPKPFPLFIYKEERDEAIKVLKQDSKIRYAEMITKMVDDGKDELHNYYLIFFGGADYSRVIDIDFVSTFRYGMDIQIKKIFQLNKDDLNTIKIKNVFEFEDKIAKTILNKPDDTFYINYFGEEKVVNKQGKPRYSQGGYNQFLNYRKAFYDFIYKSKREAISQRMFDDILLKGILDDIKTDDYDTKTEQNSNRPKILEKLNIWFTLYNFFHLSKQENLINMISKIERHRKKIDAIIEKNSKELLSNEGEFAYAAGHCVRYLYTKSKTKDKSYSRLETFVQKSNCRNLLEAITNFFVMYKHENMTNTFGRLFAQVMNFESQDNMKKYLPEFLSGFFDNNKLFSEKTQDETKNK